MKKTSLYLPDELDTAVARAAGDQGLSKAEYIRRGLEQLVHRPRRPKPSAAVFRSRDGLSARDDLDAMLRG